MKSKNQKRFNKSFTFANIQLERVYGTRNKTLKKQKNSYKIHSNNISPLTKTQKSINLTMELSPKLEKLKTSKSNDSLVKPNLSNVNLNKRHSLSIYKVSKSPRVISQTKSKKSHKNFDVKDDNTRKFPKSPKIVLKLNSSKKLNLSKLKIFDSNKTISPIKRRSSTFSMTTNINKKNCETSATYNTDIVAFIEKNSINDTLLLKSPVVILQKLPYTALSKSSLTSFLEMHTNSLKNCHNHTPQKTSNNNLQNISASSTKRSALKSKTNSKDNLRSSFKLHEVQVKPLKFSTPINKQQSQVANGTRKLSRTSNKSYTSFNTINHNTTNTENQINLTIENEQSAEKKKDETYELIEPKTPNLQNKLRRKQNAKANKTRKLIKNSNKNATKKNVEVNFESPLLNVSDTEVPLLQTLSNKKKLTKGSDNVSVNVNKNAVRLSTAFLKRSSSVSKKTIPTAECFTPLHQTPNKSKTISTTPSVSSIKKLGLKNSTIKKVPNFAEIHKKLFAKSESILNARKRLEERHIALTTLPINNLPNSNTDKKSNALSHNSSKDGYNRFGYKIRKDEARNYILRKFNTDLRRNKQQQNKEILKGVRTNRRFELQMRSRNLNLE